jgi:hypothetical protein
MLASFMLSVDFNAVCWEGVKFRGRACQRRDPDSRSTSDRGARADHEYGIYTVSKVSVTPCTKFAGNYFVFLRYINMNFFVEYVLLVNVMAEVA